MYAAGAFTAADGAIGSTFNMMPGLFTRMFELFAQDQPDTAALRALQAEANEVIAHMVQFDVLPYEKHVLHLQGVFATPAVRQPLKRFAAEERARIEAFYARHEALSRHRLGAGSNN